jgi:hypothetical protein
MSRLYCATCAKQCVNRMVPITDKYCTTLIGAKANFGDTVFCGHCAEELDEYGMFPEEHAFID